MSDDSSPETLSSWLDQKLTTDTKSLLLRCDLCQLLVHASKARVDYQSFKFVSLELSYKIFIIYPIKNCQVLVKNLNFVAGMTRRFVSAKRLIRYFSNSSKLVEHRAQSPVREVKMLAVWPSITEGSRDETPRHTSHEI